MRISNLKNELRAVRKGHVYVEFDGAQYDIGSVSVQTNGIEDVVLLITSPFDEIDESGVTEDDFI